MQFITNGPDIPDALLQAHEEGRVVFFCGSGISYPAGLPGFKGLVEEIFSLTGKTYSDVEREAFERGQFDAALDLLERRLPGQRLAVRRALAQVLQPKLRRKGATDTQTALLRLARNHAGALRLVTSNFDRVFQAAAKRTGQTFRSYSAPMLPIPKNSRWDGLVYLHGLLPETVDDVALNRLVVTSGDFGMAYLTERWAARFVSELFRNYVVCFVGYSINDPVLRYMMDALAADRMLGEVSPQAWALGDCEPGQEHRKTIEWEAKGVTSILYTVAAGSRDHSALHQSLQAWAETYRDGIQGKEAIVVKHAMTQPQESTQQDDFVGRMLWALSDNSGLPAKRFAEFNPAPSLDWLLEAFADERFCNGDLPRFGVQPQEYGDNKLRFSLIQRPAPYDRALSIQLVSSCVTGSQWDDVMLHLARWLVRHLNDPRLIIWISERGGQLHERLIWLIERELDRFSRLEREGKTSELDEIRAQAPRAIPSPLMRTLWLVILSGRVKSPGFDPDLYRWKGRFSRDGLTTILRLKLRELLTPMVAIKRPIRWRDEDFRSTDDPTRIGQLVDWELVLATNHVRSMLRDLSSERWSLALPQLLEEFQQLLRDALDLKKELEDANEHNDRSHWDLPSISPHWQNRGFRDWVSLIELLRDSWVAVRSIDGMRATSVARAWFKFPYPTFKRLAFFAASHDDCISSDQWVDWLLLNDSKWLWSPATRREVFRLIVLQGQYLKGDVQERLEAAILKGPLREMYKEDLDADRWNELMSHSVWLYLAKLKSSGLTLGGSSAARLIELSTANPQWQLAPNERDEFSHWMIGTGDPGYEDKREVDIAPRRHQELLRWLVKPLSDQRLSYQDTWGVVCRKRFSRSLIALRDLARDGVWPTSRWQEALRVWAEDGMVLRSWKYAAPLVQTMPDPVLQELDHAITWWMEAASKSIDRHEDVFLNICHRVLKLSSEAASGLHAVQRDSETYDIVGTAINHPIGYVTQGILNLWFKRSPSDNDLLPSDVKPLFTMLCDAKVERFRHGRVLLSSRLIALHRVDRLWTEQHLLPMFAWDNPSEAKAMWQGFLWSPRLYQPLLVALKPQLLESVNHLADMGEHRKQFVVLLTYAALERVEGFSVEDFRSAFGGFPREGLEEAAEALSQALEVSGDQRGEYWKNRAQPFWKQIWPQFRDLRSPRIAESLVQLVIAANEEFPAALNTVQDWLMAIEHPDPAVHRLHESGLCKKYPGDALWLLNAVIDEQQWAPRDLTLCLDGIEQSAPHLVQDTRLQRLRDYARRRE